MVVILAPSTQIVPGGTTQPANCVVSFNVNTGDVVTYGLSSATPDVGVVRVTFDFDLNNGCLGPRIINNDTAWTATNVSHTYTATKPETLTLQLSGGGEPPDSSHGTAFGVFVDLAPVSLVPCAYGTQIQPGAQFVVLITTGVLDVWLTTVEMPWLAVLLSATVGTYLNAEALCAQGPPALPVIDLSTINAAANTVLQVLYAIAWPNVCECKPGSPAPIPYPLPSSPMPAGWPSPPTFSCDNANICATLSQIQEQVAQLQRVLGQNLLLTTLYQRYQLPFAFIDGARHSGLSGTGAFAVSRLVGVRVEVLAYPPTNRQLIGEPTYIYDLGWVSVLTADGFIDEMRLTRSATAWLPRLMGTATQVGFGLREGVTVAITELEAEP